MYIAAKFYFRGRFWIKLTDIDLDSGMRHDIDSGFEDGGRKSGLGARGARNALAIFSGDAQF